MEEAPGREETPGEKRYRGEKRRYGETKYQTRRKFEGEEMNKDIIRGIPIKISQQRVVQIDKKWRRNVRTLFNDLKGPGQFFFFLDDKLEKTRFRYATKIFPRPIGRHRGKIYIKLNPRRLAVLQYELISYFSWAVRTV